MKNFLVLICDAAWNVLLAPECLRSPNVCAKNMMIGMIDPKSSPIRQQSCVVTSISTFMNHRNQAKKVNTSSCAILRDSDFRASVTLRILSRMWLTIRFMVILRTVFCQSCRNNRDFIRTIIDSPNHLKLWLHNRTDLILVKWKR